MTKAAAIWELRRIQQRFFFGLAGYALMTREPTRSALSGYKVTITNSHLSVEVPGDSTDLDQSIRLAIEITYSGAIHSGAAREVVHMLMRSLVVESFEVTRVFARSIGALPDLKNEEWYPFAYHLRNAYAHGERWSFRGPGVRLLPAHWRKMEITLDMDGSPVAHDFIGWFDALQLRAVMYNWISVQP